MKTFCALVLLSIVSLVFCGCADPSAGGADHPRTSFARFDAEAKAGKRLTVAFFGASLTWGANATDHARTSYRARVAQKLEAKYPEARFTFIDGAIGGTGSNLGIFRLQRDCLTYKPDLVFLDFSANDDIYSDGPLKLATYESLARRIVTEGNCPFVTVIFPFKWNSTPGTAKDMKGRLAHIKIAEAYGAPVGDAIVHIQNRVAGDSTIPRKVWNIDSVHPGDYGYQLFAEAAWQGFSDGIRKGRICKAPKAMLHASTYMTWSRNPISQFKKLPEGWAPGAVSRTSAWYDAYMPRWLDSVVIAKSMTVKKDRKTKKETKTVHKVDPLIVKFKADSVLLFGEETTKSGKYLAFVDGEPCTWMKWEKTFTEFDLNSTRYGGNRQHYRMLKTGLDPTKVHTLEIRPLFSKEDPQELRFESICLAGGEAKIVE
ncbi:MAG: SGNH/GDSL hydrolase family protein [Planctomycetota bacterium]|jgi:lysophospholipase L1-like esterase